MSDIVKVYEDDTFFIRDDVATGIVIDECRRFSVFCKKPYRRVIVYNVGVDGTEDEAIQLFLQDQEVLLLAASQLD